MSPSDVVPASPVHSGLPCPDAFWLDGCAWGCGYYGGLVDGFLDRWGEEIYQKRWGGASAGALFALAMVLGRSPEDLIIAYQKFARQGARYGVWGKMSIYHDAVLQSWLEGMTDEEVCARVNGRLFVGLTAFPCEHVLKSRFVDIQDLLDTLHGSFHIPWYCSHVAPIRRPAPGGEGGGAFTWYIDGGLSKNVDADLCGEAQVEGLTLNISPVLTGRVGFFDCMFPMGEERLAEVTAMARRDALNLERALLIVGRGGEPVVPLPAQLGPGCETDDVPFFSPPKWGLSLSLDFLGGKNKSTADSSCGGQQKHAGGGADSPLPRVMLGDNLLEEGSCGENRNRNSPASLHGGANLNFPFRLASSRCTSVVGSVAESLCELGGDAGALVGSSRVGGGGGDRLHGHGHGAIVNDPAGMHSKSLRLPLSLPDTETTPLPLSAVGMAKEASSRLARMRLESASSSSSFGRETDVISRLKHQHESYSTAEGSPSPIPEGSPHPGQLPRRTTSIFLTERKRFTRFIVFSKVFSGCRYATALLFWVNRTMEFLVDRYGSGLGVVGVLGFLFSLWFNKRKQTQKYKGQFVQRGGGERKSKGLLWIE
uniref:PNPLA domain-containing protein n=1 Tax=Chromera velia CCMP2878 TaxID=1169474 RepID=A0A0G4I970_9ALVE|eukprot:Cvel_12191.t1-p1 / transcript=Cvel_12191.t1 / gene=Cvel_12191 / organism=Chromera_velia_CCMP2878 / gene_product=hypothetical protein / transcript_product=hypothetical protein / location=Cvel_scaffold788:10375-12511(+) / protein_length=595 / sequence_SO=supercontig / SO=protein_coding / is_pseudo=false